MQNFPAQAQAIHDAGGKVFHQDIGAANHLFEEPLPRCDLRLSVMPRLLVFSIAIGREARLLREYAKLPPSTGSILMTSAPAFGHHESCIRPLVDSSDQ